MQRNFDNKDFEQFLKRNADQYRMYPSEKVWKEIHNSLHSRRRWTGVVASLLLITGAIVTWMMVVNPGTDKINNTLQTKTNTPSVIQTSPVKPVTPLLDDINTNKPIAFNKIPSIIVERPTQQDINEPIPNVNNNVMTGQNPVTTAELLNEEHNLVNVINNDVEDISKSGILFSPLSGDNPESSRLNTIKQDPHVLPAQASLLSMKKSDPVATSQKNRTKKKVSFQLYFTPGVSYRRLTQNKEVILAAAGSPSVPTNLALRDVKNVVTHKPDIGFELGLGAKYPVSNRLTVKTGIQFNVNKYDIRAFSYSGEPATIAIQADGPVQQTVIRTSYYRTSSGYRPNWLSNVYFSLSMPIGLELKIVNSKKFDLGLGATAQPTYLLDNRAFMISTDYKNYVKVPDLIRRWNINAGAELFVSIKSGKTKWQIGPQVRYQTLSSFKDKYPVKENLFNFGVKAGVSLNQ